MGYTTKFSGEVTITPLLNKHEIGYLSRFAQSRRMLRGKGPYYAEPGDKWGHFHDGDVLDYNEPAHNQPGLWCQWVPTVDGTMIKWDGGEKFYFSAKWMAYLIDTFLKPGATLRAELRSLPAADDSPDGGAAGPTERCSPSGRVYPAEFAHFTFDHRVNGVIEARGADPADVWRLIVRDNVVSVQVGEIS